MEAAVSRIHVLAISVFLIVAFKLFSRRQRSLKAPGIGYGSLPILGPWQGAIAFLRDPYGTLKRGCMENMDGYFKVSTHTVEYLIVVGKEQVAEYLSQTDDVLSFTVGVDDILQAQWTLGINFVDGPNYFDRAFRGQLHQMVRRLRPAMFTAIRETIGSRIGVLNDWTEVKLYDCTTPAIAAASTAAFTGDLFWRNDEYLDLASEYAQSVYIAAEFLRLFPNWLKKSVIRLFPLRRMQKRARQILGPTVQQRLDGDWKDGEIPSDFLQVMVDKAPPSGRNMPEIVERLMAFNMASISTTSLRISFTLFALLREADKYLPVLRAEALEHSTDGQIGNMDLDKLTKLDSFLREAGRLEVQILAANVRVAVKDFTFADGMFIPKGTHICQTMWPTHFDGNPDVKDALSFDGFRYSKLNEATGGASKTQMVNTAPDNLVFGHGKHACPGRFLAVAELKLIIATILLNYDLKLVPGTQPKSFYWGFHRIPDMKMKILMKSIPPSQVKV